MEDFVILAGQGDGPDGDGDTLRRNHLARAGTSRVGSGQPGFIGIDGGSGIGLEVAEEDVTGRTGTGDERADRADERCNGRIHHARRFDSRAGDIRCHAAVAHDFSRSDDGDDGDDRIAQAFDGVQQDDEHFTETGRLGFTTDEGSQQDEDTRRIDPDESIRYAALTGIDEDRRFNSHERCIDEGNEFRRQQ